ncbi:hypothetical protein [Empedobacter brevis]
MKKIIFLAMLAVSSITLTSCVNNDDGYYEEVNTQNTVTYDNLRSPLNYGRIMDVKQAEGGFYYSLELSSDPVYLNGNSSSRVYIYATIFHYSDSSFSGTYSIGAEDYGIDEVYYYENVNLRDGIVQNYDLGIGPKDIKRGRLRLNGDIFNSNKIPYIETEFQFIDSYNNLNLPIYGNFGGDIEYIRLFNKNLKSSSLSNSSIGSRKNKLNNILYKYPNLYR